MEEKEIKIILRTNADFNVVKRFMLENFTEFEMTSGELRYENKSGVDYS